jgi:hypothetical protein
MSNALKNSEIVPPQSSWRFSKLDKPLPNHTPEVSSPLKGSSVAYLYLCGSMCEMDIVGVKIHIMKPINALKVRHPRKESPLLWASLISRRGLFIGGLCGTRKAPLYILIFHWFEFVFV